MPSNQKPLITIFSDSEKEFNQLQSRVHYPSLKFELFKLKLQVWKRVINRIAFTLNKSLVYKNFKKDKSIDFLYPNPTQHCFSKIQSKKKGFWIPDFQEEHLPEFFTNEEIELRRLKNEQYTSQNSTVIFSSYDAKKDFDKFYPKSIAKKYVLPFVVTPKEIETVENEHKITQTKYGISEKFILIPNQLWIHKNHKIIIHAANEIRKLGGEVLFVCTGKEIDNRYPNYPNELKAEVKKLGLNNFIKFLGFIPKKDLDDLFYAAEAILQPSLFEGWNTTIETAKAQSRYVIASDINVHKEQLSDYTNYTLFSKDSPTDMANKVLSILDNKPTLNLYDYKKHQEKFADLFIKIIE